uniref:MatE protein n=1 Tax=Candidatus Kentrum sp. LFY TaxID=2126342 RepID=A0A450UTD5_9GAMM|nr:MAG: hypothetical protein BECKLFY1418A_GA0070994_10268 [Candidatus Kentron sp. LFY]VFJ95799.1 MAG: hypothetical protein BECKLFY1418B_GA0070995_107419 [Candidatus Kentron sp. LFY]
MAWRTVVGQVLNGLSDMKISTLISTLAYWAVGLPIGVRFGFVMELGILGLWWGLIIGMVVAAMVYLVRFRWVVRKFRM